MKIFAFFISLFALIVHIEAKQSSSSPMQITKGSGDDTHAAFVNSDLRVNSKEEWLAFARWNGVGSNILLIKSKINGTAWTDTTYLITDDSAHNEFPTLARAYYGPNDYRMMLVWERWGDLYYSYKPADVWLPMQALTHDSVLNRRPCISPTDSGFILTWERNAQIFFSEFDNDTWTAPVAVTPAGDSTNYFPQITPLTRDNVPLILWEKMKIPDSTRAIFYTLRKSDGTWRSPDTIMWEGDNHHPTFARQNFPRALFAVWESYQNNNWDLYGISGYLDRDSMFMESASNLTATTDIDERHCTFIVIGIVTQTYNNTSQYFYSEAATWERSNNDSDDIAFSRGDFSMPDYYSMSPTSIDRSPFISSGIFLGNILRVWSVWESDSSGRWKLYGTYKDIFLGEVKPDKDYKTFYLFQNYPNPFNPSTEITYSLLKPSMVNLNVYDILGRKLATLVNEKKQAGEYKTRWNGSGYPDGIYFYRFIAGDYIETKKMILIK